MTVAPKKPQSIFEELGDWSQTRTAGIGEVVLYGCPPADQQPWIPDPNTAPAMPVFPYHPPVLPPGISFTPQPDYDLRFREVMDELRTLRQAVDKGLDKLRSDIYLDLALIFDRTVQGLTNPVTRVTPKPAKAKLKSSHRSARNAGRKGRKHGKR